MARRRGSEERKLRTREHVLADLSANFVEKQALLCGYAVERVRFDYGIDLLVQTFNRNGEVESGRILFQLKATDRVRFLTRSKAIACRIEKADLTHWLEEPSPVVLVLYDAKTDCGYWCFVQQYFARLVGFALENCRERLTVQIARSDLLDRQAMKSLAKAKNAAAERYRKVWKHGLQ